MEDEVETDIVDEDEVEELVETLIELVEDEVETLNVELLLLMLL